MSPEPLHVLFYGLLLGLIFFATFLYGQLRALTDRLRQVIERLNELEAHTKDPETGRAKTRRSDLGARARRQATLLVSLREFTERMARAAGRKETRWSDGAR